MTEEKLKLIHGLLDSVNVVLVEWGKDNNTSLELDTAIGHLIEYMIDNEIGKNFNYHSESK